MEIKQFYDKGLAHASYAVLSEKEIVVIDPERDPAQYIEFAKANQAIITGIVETHLHADFVSSHVELSKLTGAKIYVSRLAEAEYSHSPLDEGSTIFIGKGRLVCINTPGHSPDSISLLLIEDEKPKAVFTGDTLFVGDVGRPDLRESNSDYTRQELAELLFHSLSKKLLKLPEDTIVYPAHGPGSLCGKNLGPELQSTIGKEMQTNSALSYKDEKAFIENLLKDQPFVPGYFPYNVFINKKGCRVLAETLRNIKRNHAVPDLQPNVIVVDTRTSEQYSKGHLKGALNIQLHKSFETWLGTLISPDEKFYLAAENDEELELAIRKSAKIGYELNIKEAFVIKEGEEKSNILDQEKFQKAPHEFTVVDVRTNHEHEEKIIFDHSINIPLHELRKRVNEIPSDKPIVVHCAAGTRSAIASSVIQSHTSAQVFDLGESIKKYSSKIS